MMKVGVAYAIPGKQVWLDVELPEGSTVQDAIYQSGILWRFPEIDLAQRKVGIFGKLAKLDAPLKEGDRVEIYRPITADPKSAKRQVRDEREE
jgi:uncharacterized protein